jgi:hypothetical protein
MTDAPVISPRLRDRLSSPGHDAALLGSDAGHDGRVVGRLEQRVAGGEDNDGRDVAGDAERSGSSASRHAAA